MDIDLTGQATVVTGAGRGIGLVVTRALTASGARAIAGALHSSAELDKLAAEGTVTTFEAGLPAGEDLAGPVPTGRERQRSGCFRGGRLPTGHREPLYNWLWTAT
jgi:NAD(P)-dependent dehydrogenase (short-subunit alcohol dehydrogenase family)